MARYKIIDEPQSKSWGEKIIVDPTIILFVAILVPLFWNPPYMGRFWMPALWLIVNGYALGSSTLRREIGTLVVGALLCYAILRVAIVIPRIGALQITFEGSIPYMRILLFGVFFLTLYLVVFRQGKSYELFKYIRGDQ